MFVSIPEQAPELPALAPLGINAKFAAIVGTRRLQAFDQPEMAQTLKLVRFGLQSEARSLLGWKRLNECLRAPVQALVGVVQSVEHGTCAYSGLATCGSVWACPVCTAKISERRREELNKAIDAWKAKGGSVLLLTLTFPHDRGDQLGEVLEGFLSAIRRMTSVRAYKAWKDSWGVQGTIRALEVTSGANGWHPHAHILVFSRLGEEYWTENPEQLAEMKAELYPIWRSWCFKAGLGEPSFQHGLDLRDGSYAADYASKWGMASELTKANVKKGRGASRSPWDLLRASLLEDDQEAGRLFVEYANHFKGRKQLVWSKGLRAELGLGVELTDEEVAEQQDDQAVELGRLERESWRVILRAEARAEVLIVAEREGWKGVLAFIEKLDITNQSTNRKRIYKIE